MTNQDWKTLQEKYENMPYAYIEIMVGKFKISLERHIIKNKIKHWVFVDGFVKGEWFAKGYEGSEILFMYPQPYTVKGASAKDLKRMKREFGAKYAKQFEPKKTFIKVPIYPSFTAFKRQMLATGLPISIIPEP